MTKNHRNRSWRSAWTPEPVSHTVVHKSGVTARVQPSPSDPTKDQITLDGIGSLDTTRWNVGKLIEQAVTLWMEGAFDDNPASGL